MKPHTLCKQHAFSTAVFLKLVPWHIHLWSHQWSPIAIPLKCLWSIYDLDLRTWPRYPFTWSTCWMSGPYVRTFIQESGNTHTMSKLLQLPLTRGVKKIVKSTIIFYLCVSLINLGLFMTITQICKFETRQTSNYLMDSLEIYMD